MTTTNRMVPISRNCLMPDAKEMIRQIRTSASPASLACDGEVCSEKCDIRVSS